MRERVVLFMVRFVVHDFEGTVDLLKQHDPKIWCENVSFEKLSLKSARCSTLSFSPFEPPITKTSRLLPFSI